MNEVLEKLPRHLLDLVIEQPYNDYTPQDHAVWRYVMRQNVDYLSKVGHHSYLEGLKKTGISIDSIPHMYGMNRILKEIGWAAVAVDGFIPPAAFMEFQAYNVLVIAADIRPIDQIEYTPAPDIIHEAAGHAPIIADKEYAAYLRRFGEIGSQAFSSKEDYSLYEAIRHLSILKADPYTSPEEVQKAEKHLAELDSQSGEPSEMSLIRNLHWWTVEYGLIGDLNTPKIYGAGLLSSIGESKWCLTDEVEKLPYSLEAKNYSFDITKPQPQLFVTPDFEMLNAVLEEFASSMALKRGGIYGINQAIRSSNTATARWSSGLQVSGIFTEMIEQNGHIVYIKTTSPTILCHNNKVVPGHGKDYHAAGFGSPVGKLKGIDKPLEEMNRGELANCGIQNGSQAALEFETGVNVSGYVKNISTVEGKNLLISFRDCHVSYRGQNLFEPSWGIFDMAVGEKINSVYNGPADPVAYELHYQPPQEKTHKIKHSSEKVKLHNLYSQVRKVRSGIEPKEKLTGVWQDLKIHFPEDWLLPLEIYEYLLKSGNDDAFLSEIKTFLEEKKSRYPSLINNGLRIAGK